VFDGRLWTWGGGTYPDPVLDIWSTGDGVTWRQDQAAPWSNALYDIEAIAGTKSRLYVLTSGAEAATGELWLWQMDRNQNWAKVGLPPGLGTEDSDSQVAFAGWGDFLLAADDEGDVWLYVPPLEEPPTDG
jgi:hypothetical protein